MKALSIRQPWAWLIIRPDITDPAERIRARHDGTLKIVENRDWVSRYRGSLLIHASKACTRREYDNVRRWLDSLTSPAIQLPPLADLDRGGIVGKVEMVGCVTRCASQWFFGAYGFVFEHAQPVPFRPVCGALGFFEVPGP